MFNKEVSKATGKIMQPMKNDLLFDLRQPTLENKNILKLLISAVEDEIKSLIKHGLEDDDQVSVSKEEIRIYKMAIQNIDKHI